MLGLDAYSIPARVVPPILVVLPVGIGVGVWFEQSVLSWTIGGGLTVVGVLFLVAAESVRRLGRAVQDRIYKDLGAKPTTILLRHRDTSLDQPTKRRYHQKLRDAVPGCRLPTATEELADAVAADAQYDSCVRFLLEQTRDRKLFPLVFRELVSYGLIRNLRGMRVVAIVLAVTGIVACVARLKHDLHASVHGGAVVGVLLSAALLAVWVVRLNDRWVREASFDYARALLASCDAPRPR